MKETHRYDDIIHLPHPVSKKHPPMDRLTRAAQFSPFAALTGHGEAIRETERITSAWMELDEQSLAVLDETLQRLRAGLKQGQHPELTVRYFVPDEKKEGGSYVTVTGRLQKILENSSVLVLQDGSRIEIGRIVELC